MPVAAKLAVLYGRKDVVPSFRRLPAVRTFEVVVRVIAQESDGFAYSLLIEIVMGRDSRGKHMVDRRTPAGKHPIRSEMGRDALYAHEPLQ